MTGVREQSTGKEAEGWLDLASMVTATLLAGILVYFGIERDAMFGTTHLGLTPAEQALGVATVLATTWWFMLPVLAAAGVARIVRLPTASRVIFVAGCVVVHTLVIHDVLIYKTFGLHLLDLLAFARLPRWEVAGGFSQWVWTTVRWSLIVLVFSSVLAAAARGLVLITIGRATKSMRIFLSALAGGLIVTAALVPHEMGQFWSHQIMRERLYGFLPVDLRRNAHEQGGQVFHDPILQTLHRGTSDSYRRNFPLVFGPKPVDPDPTIRADRPPNVILIVLESFRHTALNASLMPRLFRWSERGLRSTRHHAGSIYSESGLFALLYGRSPLVYHATLDAGIKPAMCEILGRSGYETAYFSGHPKKWMRREDYINANTFDRFVHNDNGGWNEWDHSALSSMVTAAKRAQDRPLFALVFLMSTHFEYQYPPAYERFKPVARDASWAATRLAALGPDAREPVFNRYRNAIAFLDDEVADAIESLDPRRNLIIVTGDHGESIYDDGRYGHGYAFSDIVARVPFVAVGPGIPTRVDDALTLHADALPTVLHVLEGDHVPVEHIHGRDLLKQGAPRRTALLAHCGVNRDEAMALLLHDQHRLSLVLDLHQPRLELRGLEDHRGQLKPQHGLTSPGASRLLEAFESELAIARR